MKLLLDTHVLVWSQEDDPRLGKKTRRRLLNVRNELLVSAVSTLEIARLLFVGRLSLQTGLDAWLTQALQGLEARSLVVDHRVAEEAFELPGNFHKDPADRLLVASARLEGAALVTADKSILEYPHVLTKDARE
jgi:PIN domain nuclease of toxin-antitoxin system